MQLKLGLLIIKLPRLAMFPFPENYVPIEVTNKLTLTSQQKSPLNLHSLHFHPVCHPLRCFHHHRLLRRFRLVPHHRYRLQGPHHHRRSYHLGRPWVLITGRVCNSIKNNVQDTRCNVLLKQHVYHRSV